MRYVHVRRLAWRGAVNAVPEICSAYRPYATRCGEFWPTGSAPAMRLGGELVAEAGLILRESVMWFRFIGTRRRPRARRAMRGAQHVEIADVIGKQQDQLRVHERALRVVEIAMRVDQRLVEVVGCREVGVVMSFMMSAAFRNGYVLGHCWSRAPSRRRRLARSKLPPARADVLVRPDEVTGAVASVVARRDQAVDVPITTCRRVAPPTCSDAARDRQRRERMRPPRRRRRAPNVSSVKPPPR